MSPTGNQVEDPRGGCGLDVAAYALGALDPLEADAFAEHVKSCTMCREELTDFEAVVTTLPISVPQHAVPARLRRRVLGTVQDEVRAGAAAPSPARRAGRWSWLASPRPAIALGAAVAVLAVAVLGSSNSPRRPIPRTQAHVYAAQVSGVHGSAEVKVTGGHGELIVRDLDPPPAGKLYELWLARPHRPLQPAGPLFSVDLEGDSDIVVPGSLHGVTALSVTPEPAGGSRAPTHAPVIRAPLT